MKNLLIKIWKWLCTHKDWAHIIGGFGFGFVFDSMYPVLAAAVTSEIKDFQWGGKGTLRDFLLTCAGGIIGYGIRYVFKTYVF